MIAPPSRPRTFRNRAAVGTVSWSRFGACARVVGWPEMRSAIAERGPDSDPADQSVDFLLFHNRYTVLDPASTSFHLICTRAFRARARLRFHEVRYRWTGSGVERAPEVIVDEDDPTTDLHRVHGPIVRSGEDRIFLVDLGRDIARGEEATVKYGQALIDRHGTCQPFHRMAVRHPLDRLVMEVVLPAELQSNVRWLVTDLVTDEPAEPSREVTPCESDPNLFRVALDDPKVGCRFALHWT